METPTSPAARDSKAPPLELISIHVPKTAGSSFRRILETAYDEPGAFQPIYTADDGVELLWEDRLPQLDPRTRALHGHFPATPAFLESFPHAKLVAWIREPVARTVSYYNYWKRTPPHGNPHHDEFLQRNLSIVDFARHPEMRREMQDYFRRVDLDDFFFIGLTERFDADVRLLAERLGWPPPEVPRVNTAPGPPQITGEEHRELEAAMADAIDLYERIKALRGLA